jgi:hypothetical protein
VNEDKIVVNLSDVVWKPADPFADPHIIIVTGEGIEPIVIEDTFPRRRPSRLDVARLILVVVLLVVFVGWGLWISGKVT